MMGGHNEGKFIDEASVELGHPIENLCVPRRFRCGHNYQDLFQIR